MNLEKTFQDFRYGIRGQKGASTEDTMKACLAASRGKTWEVSFGSFDSIFSVSYSIVCTLNINAQLDFTFFRFLPALLTSLPLDKLFFVLDDLNCT